MPKLQHSKAFLVLPPHYVGSGQDAVAPGEHVPIGLKLGSKVVKNRFFVIDEQAKSTLGKLKFYQNLISQH